MMEKLNDLIDKLYENDVSIYIVGGFIRTSVYNKVHGTNMPIKDIDFVVSGIKENKLMEILKIYGKVKHVGLAFGVIIFKPNNSDEVFEIALPRKEISTGCEYKSFDIEIDPFLPIEKELGRRDFTINAMCVKINCVDDIDNIASPDFFDLDKVIDPFGGIQHVRDKICCCVNRPYDRFKDDPTRIFRAFRISAQSNLIIENETMIGIEEHKDLLNNLIPSSSIRLYNELFKIIKCDDCLKTLELMSNIGILKIIGIKTKIDMFRVIETTDVYLVKVMILLKDVFCSNFDQWINFYQISAVNDITKDDIISLKLSHNNEIINNILKILNKYDMLIVLNKIGKYTKNNCKECMKYLIEYLCIYDRANKHFLHEILSKCDDYPVLITDIMITGNEIIEITNKNGPSIGAFKEKLLDEIFKDNITNDNTELKRYLLLI
jgi:tRNA nucleotidyltransferase/poly(A) polymerase